jgi:hypothetical protein
MQSIDLWNFLGGIAQGARRLFRLKFWRVKIRITFGKRFRGLGEATRKALSPVLEKGQTVGVAGFISVLTSKWSAD